MSDEPSTHLRNRPRQARSAARVEHLLDVAEEVFEEVGYDTATTNLVAARAGVPVGTLYRWFPDKSALAEGLTDRYLEKLEALYAGLMTDIAPEERIGDFVRRVMTRLADEIVTHRAMPALLVSAMVPGGRSRAGARLRAGLESHISALLEVRVPGIPDDLRGRSAEVIVTLAYLVLAAAADTDNLNRRVITDEYIDVMLAYLEAKFPSPDHPAWTDPEVVVKPVFAAPDRAHRLAAAREG